MALHNGREREREEWEPLFQKADPRFGPLRFFFEEGAALAVIESIWQG